jgi:transcription elongation factor Elf1
VPRTATERLLRSARKQLEEWGTSLPDKTFVCPVCLRLLPVSKATTGHYPSEKAGGGQYALQCDVCNHRLGAEIERNAVRVLNREWDMIVGPPGRGRVRMPITLDAKGPSIDIHGRGAMRQWHTLRALSTRSSRPDVLESRLIRPHDDALRMAILAWSYSEWVNYSGLSYCASAGAGIVRRLLLDGSLSIPPSIVVFFDDPLSEPLGRPEPVLVVNAKGPIRALSDVDEVIGIGVFWGRRMVGILPMAGDENGDVYARVSDLVGGGTRVRYAPLKQLVREAGLRRLDQELLITDRDRGVQLRVTAVMSPEDQKLLIRDKHPRRIDPRSGTRRHYPAGEVRDFVMVEDLIARRASPLPHVSEKKTRRLVTDRLGRLERLLAVRNKAEDRWHVASHVRLIDGAPRDAVVFCGRDVRLRGGQVRPLTGTGVDGSDPVCRRCSEIIAIRSAAERRRERPPAG